MARPRGKKTDVRLSVGFDELTYGVLSALAHQNDTTVAWVVRRAVAEFIERRGQDQPELPLRQTTVGRRDARA